MSGDRLQALSDAATPGTWFRRYDSVVIPNHRALDGDPDDWPVAKCDSCSGNSRAPQPIANAAFIVAVVNGFRAGELVAVPSRDELEAVLIRAFGGWGTDVVDAADAVLALFRKDGST